MFRELWFLIRLLVPALLVLAAIVVALGTLSQAAKGSDLLLATAGGESNAVQLQNENAAAEVVLELGVTEVAAVAMSPHGEVFLASGSDGVIHKLQRGRMFPIFTHPGQIADLAFGSDPDTLFFSALRSPQSGEAPADGEIYRLDLSTLQVSRFFTVSQAQVDRAWWGAFTIHDGCLHLATRGAQGQSAKVLRWNDSSFEPVWETHALAIHGLDFAENGDLFLADGEGCVFRAGGIYGLVPEIVSPEQRIRDVALTTAGDDTLLPPRIEVPRIEVPSVLPVKTVRR